MVDTPPTPPPPPSHLVSPLLQLDADGLGGGATGLEVELGVLDLVAIGAAHGRHGSPHQHNGVL